MPTLPIYLRLLKVSVTVLFWLTVLSFALLMIFTLKSTKLAGSPSFTLNLPYVRINNAPGTVFKEAGREVAINSTARASVSFYYPDAARFKRDFGHYVGQFLFPTITLFSLLLLGLWQLKRIFDTLGTPDVFSHGNVRRIRLIAGLLIIYQLLPGFIWLLIQSDVTTLLNTHQVRYSVVYDLKLVDALMTGVLVFGLAEVFRSGVRLREEQDLTI